MIFVALEEASRNKELLLVNGGMCRFHKRLDGVVVIREILVLPDFRRQGIGKRLVAEVQRRHPRATVRAKCPESYVEGNLFWGGMGFRLIESGEFNLWEF